MCMSDNACVRHAQDNGFCGMSGTSDTVLRKQKNRFFLQNNVRRVRHPTKTIVLVTSDTSNVRHAYFRALQTRACTACPAEGGRGKLCGRFRLTLIRGLARPWANLVEFFELPTKGMLACVVACLLACRLAYLLACSLAVCFCDRRLP